MLSDSEVGEGGVGYFPASTSMLHRVQKERAVGLLFGQRALLIGALDARNYVGTAEHSRYRDQPFKRLAATAKMFETIFFGSKREADKVLAVVHRMHSTVEGELGEDSGGFSPGTAYRAFDPEMMLWTIAPAADSGVYFHERLVGPLTSEERNRYWADWVRFGELFGMPRDVAPAGWSAFQRWFRGRMESSEMGLTEEARLTGFGVAFRIPFAVPGPLPREAHNLVMLGSLPRVVREHYGLPWSRSQQVAYDATCRALRASRRVQPAGIRRGRCAAHYDAVARQEAKLTAVGRPPIALPAAAG